MCRQGSAPLKAPCFTPSLLWSELLYPNSSFSLSQQDLPVFRFTPELSVQLVLVLVRQTCFLKCRPLLCQPGGASPEVRLFWMWLQGEEANRGRALQRSAFSRSLMPPGHCQVSQRSRWPALCRLKGRDRTAVQGFEMQRALLGREPAV